MKKDLKVALFGALATLGLASAAMAHQSDNQRPTMPAEEHQKMMSGDGMMGHGDMMMPMMNDPEMRKQMAEMMGGCAKMMNLASSTSSNRPRTPLRAPKY